MEVRISYWSVLNFCKRVNISRRRSSQRKSLAKVSFQNQISLFCVTMYLILLSVVKNRATGEERKGEIRKREKRQKSGTLLVRQHCAFDELDQQLMYCSTESVFAPKDIDLDAIDDDERELEAFKRFCFNSVPPEHKEKVHLNLKDLVIKKKP
jgi:FAM193 family C-terminal